MKTLGIELGSTTIKSVLISEGYEVLATGEFDWENTLENGIWTYSLDDVWKGLRVCCDNLFANYEQQYGRELEGIDAIGISAMMHGYLAFDENDKLLVPFRTWRNTITGEAAKELTEAFKFNIPQRWSVAHLYNAMLKGEEHVPDINFMTTLSGYVHWRLTGEKVVGVGDASGMFPIDDATKDYDEGMIRLFEELAGQKGYETRIREVMPRVLLAGDNAGSLTEDGARLLDPRGRIKAGTPFCPPEGDAGSGMVATNSVKKRTGNVSAGTSIFGMIVLDEPLANYYPELDICTTPDGSQTAMVHCNNCTTDINAWMNIFSEALNAFGAGVRWGELFEKLFKESLKGDADCGGLLPYNYYSGEHITGLSNGVPMFIHTPESGFTLANFIKSLIYSSFATLKYGMDIITQKEHLPVDGIIGHGGIFKTEEVAQRYLAAALNAPITVMKTAGSGGPWGMAILAMYMMLKEEAGSLGDFLDNQVFVDEDKVTIAPEDGEAEGFEAFMERYKKGLEIERKAAEVFRE